MICGDFNYDLIRHEHVSYVNEFFFLQPCITQPSRVLGKNRPTLIDIIFVYTYDKYLFAGNFPDKLSDHLPNSFLEILVEIINNYAPLKTLSVKKRKD